MEASTGAESGMLVDIKVKTQFKGKVCKVGLAGAVIDIGIDQPAAIHVSQILAPGDEPIKRVEDVLEVGQEVDVWVRKVKDNRIELTMIKPHDLEWREIKKSMVVKGKVVRLEKFGAFVDIGAERPGLVHISEMAHGYVHEPGDVVKEGDDVEAMVLEINRRKKQIKLSMKALQPEPEEVIKALDFVDENKEDDGKPKAKAMRRKKAPKKRFENSFDENGDVILAMDDVNQNESENETALGIALREAMERAKARKKQQDDKAKKVKALSQEQEDILSRTLEHRAPSSS